MRYADLFESKFTFQEVESEYFSGDDDTVNLLEGAIDPRRYNVQARFDHYNRLCFNGELPKMPIRFSRLKGKGAACKVKYDVPPHAQRFPSSVQKQYATHRPGSIYIVIDNTYYREEQALDGILIHEMIHAWFFVQNNFVESHGPAFKAKLAECSRKVGFEVPETENLVNPVMVGDAIRPLIVLVIDRGTPATSSFALIMPTAFQRIKDLLQQEWTQTTYNHGTTLIAYEVRSPEWASIEKMVPLQRPSSLFKTRFFVGRQIVDELSALPMVGRKVFSVAK